MDEMQSYFGAVFLQKEYKSSIDVGCTYGTLTAFIGQFCASDGVDISETYIKKARKFVKTSKFYVGNVRRWKPKKKYDVAVTHGLLIHISDKDIKKTIKNIMGFAKEAVFVESSSPECYVKNITKAYDPAKYWEHRAKHPDEKDDLPMKYYYAHDYEKIFDDLKLKWTLIKTFDIRTKTRMYHICRK